MTKHNLPIEERFFLHIDKTDTCWNWNSYVNKDGYGHFNVNGKMVIVHRFMWELKHGKIKDNLQLHHKCENKKCCNINHLLLVTPLEHMKLTKNSISYINYNKTHCKRGHLLEGDNLIIDDHGYRQCKNCIYNHLSREEKIKRY